MGMTHMDYMDFQKLLKQITKLELIKTGYGDIQLTGKFSDLELILYETIANYVVSKLKQYERQQS